MNKKTHPEAVFANDGGLTACKLTRWPGKYNESFPVCQMEMRL